MSTATMLTSFYVLYTDENKSKVEQISFHVDSRTISPELVRRICLLARSQWNWLKSLVGGQTGQDRPCCRRWRELLLSLLRHRRAASASLWRTRVKSRCSVPTWPSWRRAGRLSASICKATAPPY